MKVVLVLLLLAFSISHCNCYKEEEITDIFNMWDDVSPILYRVRGW